MKHFPGGDVNDVCADLVTLLQCANETEDETHTVTEENVPFLLIEMP